ncbi:MAG TPA: serine--tRNA ligase, partial [Micavibrio sp.]
MHDIAAIRKDPAAYDKNWARRGLSAQTPEILRLDSERRAVQTEMQELQNQRNSKSKEIGAIKAKGGDATAIMNEVAAMKERMAELESREATLAEALNQHLASLPNMLDDETPDGKSEDDNKEVRRYGEPKKLNSQTPEHFDIGEALGMMDFETAAKMSGSRFTIMHTGLARMERALAQLMLDTHTMEHGYTEVSPPLMVRDNAMYGTGQLPKFSEDLFRTTTDHWLIPTAEVSLTN